jgi:hypothetical protein
MIHLKIFLRFSSLFALCFYICLSIALFLYNRTQLYTSYNSRLKVLPKTKFVQNIFSNFHTDYRAFDQRVIAISMFGPRENSLFQRNSSLLFLQELIRDTQQVYPGWTLTL